MQYEHQLCRQLSSSLFISKHWFSSYASRYGSQKHCAIDLTTVRHCTTAHRHQGLYATSILSSPRFLTRETWLIIIHLTCAISSVSGHLWLPSKVTSRSNVRPRVPRGQINISVCVFSKYDFCGLSRKIVDYSLNSFVFILFVVPLCCCEQQRLLPNVNIWYSYPQCSVFTLDKAYIYPLIYGCSAKGNIPHRTSRR
jgi:hypothetical protein